MRNQFICAATGALLSFSVTSSAAQAKPFTFAQALAVAYEINPQLEAQRAAVRATDEEVAKAYGGWRPKASVDGSSAYAIGEYHAIPGPATGTYPRGVTATVRQPVFG